MTLFRREQRWECAACGLQDVTYEALPHTRMHNCRNGMSTPMQPAGVKCKVEFVEREDYIGKELVQTDANGRPVMAVRITRDDGVDCAVYAPAATIRGRAHDWG